MKTLREMMDIVEAISKNELLHKVTKDSNKLFKQAKSGKLKSDGRDFTKGDHWTGPDEDDPYYQKNFGHGYPNNPENRKLDREITKSLKKDDLEEESVDPLKKIDELFRDR